MLRAFVSFHPQIGPPKNLLKSPKFPQKTLKSSKTPQKSSKKIIITIMCLALSPLTPIMETKSDPMPPPQKKDPQQTPIKKHNYPYGFGSEPADAHHGG